MTTSQQKQLDLVSSEQVWKLSLLAKVEGLIPYPIYENLKRCGEEEIFCTCKACGTVEKFYYRCSMKFCPLCNWRISRAREQIIKLWAFQVKQPKHIVLTMRNFPILTRHKIREFGRAFAKLRRNKIWKLVQGGCISTEITNEGRGWHLHGHILAEVRWMDAAQLAIQWGALVGQQFGIVKVKDARDMTYLGEVTKYVVKGSQLAGWPPQQINEFIRAIRGVRFFTTFGSLFKLRRQLADQVESLKPQRQPCSCGSCDFVYEDEARAVLNQIRKESKR